MEPVSDAIMLERIAKVSLYFVRHGQVSMLVGFPSHESVPSRTTSFGVDKDEDDYEIMEKGQDYVEQEREEQTRNSHGMIMKDLKLGMNDRLLRWVFKVYAYCTRLIKSGKTSTLRDMYYHLKSIPESISYEEDLSMNYIYHVVNVCCRIARVPRYCLHLHASAVGSMSGRFEYRFSHDSPWMQATDAGEVIIPGSAIQALDLLRRQYQTHHEFDLGGIIQIRGNVENPPRYLLVIEKDAVFQQFLQSNFCLKYSCIILTGRGYPDLATRAMVSLLSETFRDMRVYGLCDWNPHGLSLMHTYQFGAGYHPRDENLESYRYSCPRLRVIGLQNQDTKWIMDEFGQPLSENDRKIAENMLKVSKMSFGTHEELRSMLTRGLKFELEVLNIENPGYLVESWIHESLLRYIM